MSINQKSGRQTFRRRFVSGSLFVSPCPPECYLQSETKIEPDLRLRVLSSTNITIPNAAKVQLSLENQNVSCPTSQSGLLQTKKKIHG